MRSAPRQLALALRHSESFAREDFLSGACNAAALTLIEAWPQWPGNIVIVTGPEGCGKSHLAAIWANLAGGRTIAARALDRLTVPGALATGALVIEDLVPQGFDEQALFHLLNLAREEDAFVLMSARTAPAGWTFAIPDLVSRVRATPQIALSAPDDVLLRAVLVKSFTDRQIAVDESLIVYLSRRIERSFAAVRAIVARLDEEAMRRKRPLTRALAAEVLGSSFA